MLIVDKPQDTSKNIQKKELKKSKRMAVRTIRVMRDSTRIERDVPGDWDQDRTQAEKVLGKAKSKEVHPLGTRSQMLWVHVLLLIRVL